MKALHCTTLSETFFLRHGDLFSPYLESAGIDPQILERPDIEIPEDRYVALWEAAGREQPNIGLELGMQTVPEDLGALGHAVSCATSVEKALEIFRKFSVILSQLSRLDFEVGEKQVIIEHQMTDPTIVYRRQYVECAVALLLRQLQLITNEQLRPVRVDFEHSKPGDTSVHKQIFECPIYFDQPVNCLYFSSSILKLEVQGNQRLYQALEPYLLLQREERMKGDDLLPRITRMIAADLSTEVPTLESIAEQLGINARKLQRTLKKQELEFSVLLENVRKELALSYVADSDYSMTEISFLLGYSESASFSRAFRRWTGKTPFQFRSSKSASGAPINPDTD